MRNAILLVVTLAIVAVTGGTHLVAAASGPSPGHAQTCAASKDGRFCLCKDAVDVCAGERAVAACTRPHGGVCCASRAGFCYCTEDASCTDADDRPVDRCAP